ncbi:MAG: hypothetical protein C0430_10605 [Flavobacterium sp.]|nr:hypothetical protein [Flavobacterium sp.]
MFHTRNNLIENRFYPIPQTFPQFNPSKLHSHNSGILDKNKPLSKNKKGTRILRIDTKKQLFLIVLILKKKDNSTVTTHKIGGNLCHFWINSKREYPDRKHIFF